MDSSKFTDALILISLWEQHDQLERDIIKLERNFTDEELDWLMESDESAEILYQHQQASGGQKPEEWHE